MIKRNIGIAYLLALAKHSWFWLGIWVFYYLRLTNYAGIGIAETTLILTSTLAEIPTGAVADLLGKRKTLIIAFLFEFVGAILMATASNLGSLVFSIFVLCVGGAFYSGTLDALVFDTLKQTGDEKKFAKIISNVNTISLISPALCGIWGGFLYKIDPTWPFWANAIGYLVGLSASFWLIEPKIDSEKFSWENFVSQTRQGMWQLLKTAEIKKLTILMLSIGFLIVIANEMLNSFLSVEFGFTVEQQGFLWAGIFLTSALASQLAPYISNKFHKDWSIILVGLAVCITFLISPIAGLILGGVSLIIRSSLEGIFNNLVSININHQADSKYRATTISTFNMIKNIPYVLTAYLVGSISDSISAKTTAFVMGILMGIIILGQLLSRRIDKSLK